MNKTENKTTKVQAKSFEKYEAVEKKSRKRIMIDNFLGGMSWGFGTVIGATLIVGIFGIIFIYTKKVPLVGDLVKVIAVQVQDGINQIKNR